MALDQELQVYRLHLPDLLANEGKFVVIKADVILPGAFETYESALAAGYERFGPVAFLVRRIEPTEQVLYYSRDV